MQRKPTAAEKRVAQMQRHTALVVAAQEATSTLMGPFSESDYVPGNIEDAVEILRAALSSEQTR